MDLRERLSEGGLGGSISWQVISTMTRALILTSAKPTILVTIWCSGMWFYSVSTGTLVPFIWIAAAARVEKQIARTVANPTPVTFMFPHPIIRDMSLDSGIPLVRPHYSGTRLSPSEAAVQEAV